MLLRSHDTRVRRTVFGRIAAFLTVLLALLAPLGIAGAQGTGRITGEVTDSISGRALSDVQISIVGSRIGAVSDARGRFNLVGVPAGARVVGGSGMLAAQALRSWEFWFGPVSEGRRARLKRRILEGLPCPRDSSPPESRTAPPWSGSWKACPPD